MGRITSHIPALGCAIVFELIHAGAELVNGLNSVPDGYAPATGVLGVLGYRLCELGEVAGGDVREDEVGVCR